jgi:thymidylate synthase
MFECSMNLTPCMRLGQLKVYGHKLHCIMFWSSCSLWSSSYENFQAFFSFSPKVIKMVMEGHDSCKLLF